ncbi:hypothetical protein RFI_23069 [Reticulomyxa filosa]|uniref:G-patch domain-containing protein n=1 Tax=Reticulomyxa filosa TaxID=46433 RepID=X6MJW6_RETFI|nr:hypothetical protein RFI_23069 [Reticulomyxa filosa]|eukprot:ETO14303.1 hypothetical protein RFI_23069 [Reticulomyxa filosa]
MLSETNTVLNEILTNAYVEAKPTTVTFRKSHTMTANDVLGFDMNKQSKDLIKSNKEPNHEKAECGVCKKKKNNIKMEDVTKETDVLKSKKKPVNVSRIGAKMLRRYGWNGDITWLNENKNAVYEQVDKTHTFESFATNVILTLVTLNVQLLFFF